MLEKTLESPLDCKEIKLRELRLCKLGLPWLSSGWDSMLPKQEAGLRLGIKDPPPSRRRRVAPVRKIPWRRKWKPTPASLPGESHGQRSPAGYSPWGLNRVAEDIGAKQQQQQVTRPHVPNLKLSHAATKIQDASCRSWDLAPLNK